MEQDIVNKESEMHKRDKYKMKGEMPGFYSVCSYLVGPRRELMPNKFLSVLHKYIGKKKCKIFQDRVALKS